MPKKENLKKLPDRPSKRNSRLRRRQRDFKEKLKEML
jgi:hypothetical protein